MLRQRALLILTGAVALAALVTPIQRDLYVGDETKYGQVVREMRGGAFFLPTLNGTPFTHKPPLHFWLVDLLTYPLGLYSIWPFVLPSLVAFVFLLWLMWKMGGALASFVCGTSLMIWASAQSARMDVSFTAFLVLAAWMIQRFIECEDRRALLYAGIATGIATLIKGPMAPVIIVALLIIERVRHKKLPRANYIPFILTMAIIPLLWFVPAMQLGGSAYTREVIVKQTAGRAVGSWVHQAAPWFYVAHAPGDLFPWFFAGVVALFAVYKRNDEQAKFYVSWILAVFIPYTLMSSKLDVYMMALIPPFALLIARTVVIRDRFGIWSWRANLLMIGIVLGIGIAGAATSKAEALLPGARVVFIILATAAAIALVISIRSRDPVFSTLAAGLVPIIPLAYVGIALMPAVNEIASTRPLVRAIQKQNVRAEDVALYSTPQLWTRDMPRDLEHVQYISTDDRPRAEVIITSRKHAQEIAPALAGLRKVDEFLLIGKPFDVYRR